MSPRTLLTLRHPYNDLSLNKRTTADIVVCLFVVETVIHLNVINTVLCVSLEKRTYCMIFETINLTEIDLNRIAVVGKYSFKVTRDVNL